ncbi:PREDICTED: centromere protein O [Nanorana parkeri]|uniref:centromere protein O n=1 Tax=Nanorana parkeri TaxID=125878 RepID=UPI00085417B6|nr:PREDICTED: centromere protein O [Nanorana parkeri]
MEQVQNLFREGVMTHLERLESLSQNLAQKQDQKRQQEADLQEKRDRIVSLQRERDELRGRVRLQNETVRSFLLLAGNPLKVHLECRHRGGALVTGISGKLKDGGACFCITAAFEGTYLDSYYIQVNSLRNPQISRHGVPSFIPLSDLAKEHLPADLRKLLHVLFERLNAYGGRKFQADKLEEKSPAYVAGSLQKNSLYTVLSFSYNITIEGQTVSFAAKLLYGDITSIFPTEVTVTCPGNRCVIGPYVFCCTLFLALKRTCAGIDPGYQTCQRAFKSTHRSPPLPPPVCCIVGDGYENDICGRDMYYILEHAPHVTALVSLSWPVLFLYADILDDEASVPEMISSHVSVFSSTALHRALDSLTT